MYNRLTADDVMALATRPGTPIWQGREMMASHHIRSRSSWMPASSAKSTTTKTLKVEVRRRRRTYPVSLVLTAPVGPSINLDYYRSTVAAM